MADDKAKNTRRLHHWRDKRALRRARTGDSAEKLAEGRQRPESVIDMMLRIGGVERESRFKE